MNRKTALTTLVVICVITMVLTHTLLYAKADDITPSAPYSPSTLLISTSMMLTPTIQFNIPAQNSTINFAQTGYYANATIVNDTWVFTDLQLDSPSVDPLSDSPNRGNVSITAQDCNVTVTSFERLLTPDPNDYMNTGTWLTAGWLNYTVTGLGNQTLEIQFGASNETDPSVGVGTWPLSVYAVFIDGRNSQYNDGWTSTVDYDEGMIVNGAGIIVKGATSNVSIEYAWVPVPSPASTRSPENSPVPIGIPSNYTVFYATIAAVTIVGVVAIAVLALTKKK